MNFSWISDNVSGALKIGGGKWKTKVAQRLRLAHFENSPWTGQLSVLSPGWEERQEAKQERSRKPTAKPPYRSNNPCSSGYIPNFIFFHHIKHTLYTSNFFFSSSPISWLGNIHKLPLLTTHYIKIPKSVMTFNNTKISDEGIISTSCA